MAGRPVGALLLAIAIASAGVSAAGLKTTPTDSTVVPSVASGDQGIYSNGTTNVAFRFEGESWLTPEGLPENGLTLTQWQSVGYTWLVEVDVGISKFWLAQGHPVATMERIGNLATRFYAGMEGTNLTTHAWHALYQTTPGDGTLPMCGLLHSLQGQAITSKGPLDSIGCPEGLVRLQDLGDGLARFGDGTSSVVIDPRYPVPAVVNLGNDTWTLTAFENEPSPIQDQSVEPVASPIAFSSTIVGGVAIPDERGVSHPFPLSEAVSFALEASPSNPLRQFMQRSGAYMAEAAFSESLDHGERRLEWRLTASDGIEAQAIAVTRQGAQVHDLPVAVPANPGIVLPTSPVPVMSETDAVIRPYPLHAEGIRFATLESAKSRWQAVADPGQDPNSWGFTIVCDGDCNRPSAQTWIGVERLRRLNPALDALAGLFGADESLRYVLERDAIWIDDSGATVKHEHTDWGYYDRVAYKHQPVEVDGATGGRATEPATTTSLIAWAMPSIEASVGATLIGLLAGLMYYLWPQLKAGALSLLRTQRHDPEPQSRISIKRFIEAMPGIHYQELRRRTGQAPGALRHHLKVLEENGGIVSRHEGGFRCFFPSTGQLAGVGLVKAPAARRMLQGICESGPLSLSEAASMAGLTPSAASHHAKRLLAGGLVTQARAGRRVELRPTQLAPKVLANAS